MFNLIQHKNFIKIISYNENVKTLFDAIGFHNFTRKRVGENDNCPFKIRKRLMMCLKFNQGQT